MDRYRHIRMFDVGFCDVDFKDELKPSVLLSYLEEAACSSGEELGFGYSKIKSLGCSFMVAEIRFDVCRMPRLGETIKLSTWPTPPSHVVFGREYELCSSRGEKLVTATSKWCLVNMSSGKILSRNVLTDQDYSTYDPSRAYHGREEKIGRFEKEEGVERFSLTIGNSECDHNMHVNNTRYADYCFNCFSVDELSRRKLRSFGISYVRQCRENEFLRFYRKDETERALLSGINENGEVVVRAEVAFSS